MLSLTDCINSHLQLQVLSKLLSRELVNGTARNIDMEQLAKSAIHDLSGRFARRQLHLSFVSDDVEYEFGDSIRMIGVKIVERNVLELPNLGKLIVADSREGLLGLLQKRSSKYEFEVALE